MDFADLRTDSNDGAWMTVMDVKGEAPIPNDKGEPIRFRIAGPDSEHGLKAIAKYRAAHAAVKGSPTPQQDIEIEAELLSGVMVDWSYMKFEGETLSCSIANVKRVMSVPGLSFIRRQALAFFWTPANFIPPSQTTK